MQDIQRFNALDSFRGLCALSVVIFHMNVAGAFSEISFFRKSDIFVDFFFILSGFVLAHSYGLRENIDFKRFLVSRTFRLFPLHLTMLVVFIALESGKYIAHQKGLDFNNIPFTGTFAPSEIVPNALLVQSWTSFTTATSFNYPAWSISIEYHMYLLFAAFMLLTLRFRIFAWTTTMVLILGLLYVESDLMTKPATRGLSCFFGGCVAYLAYCKIKDAVRPGYWAMTLLEAASLVAVVGFVESDISNKSPIAVVLFCAVVILFAFDAGGISKALRIPPMQYVGKISYSIYMTHAAILFCLTAIIMVAQKAIGVSLTSMVDGTRYIDLGGATISSALVIATVMAVITISSLTYRYIEVPGQNLGRRLSAKKALEPDNQPV